MYTQQITYANYQFIVICLLLGWRSVIMLLKAIHAAPFQLVM